MNMSSSPSATSARSICHWVGRRSWPSSTRTWSASRSPVTSAFASSRAAATARFVPVEGGVPLTALAVGGDHDHTSRRWARPSRVPRPVRETRRYCDSSRIRCGQHHLAVLVDRGTGGDVRLVAVAERARTRPQLQRLLPSRRHGGSTWRGGGPAEHVGHRGGSWAVVTMPCAIRSTPVTWMPGAPSASGRGMWARGCGPAGEGVGEGAREGGQHDACRNLTLRGLAGEAHGAVDEDHGLAGAGAAGDPVGTARVHVDVGLLFGVEEDPPFIEVYRRRGSSASAASSSKRR